MQSSEIEQLVALEDRHWWYAERRWLLRRALSSMPAEGVAVDVGAAGGGNTRVLAALGWHALAVEYSQTGAELTRSRGVPVLRADAQALPLRSSSVGLVTALDVLEHLEDDEAAAREMHRVLEPGGHLLVAVPADPRLWSAHDVAVGHVRRYTREQLVATVEAAGFGSVKVWSWNVLLRPVVARRRQSSEGSDLTALPAVVNAGLRTVVRLERLLPVKNAPGVSLFLTARRV